MESRATKDTPRTLHGLLARSARDAPERLAVLDPGRGRVDYRTLDAQSDALCTALRALGVRAGDRVGIVAPKSIGTVTAIFATLKAGAAYVPVDSGAPPRRNAFILRDCAVAALVVERALVAGLEAELPGLDRSPRSDLRDLDRHGCDLVLLRAPSFPGAPVPDGFDPAAAGLSYVLYTSGSTGTPKGVMHSHSTALSFVDWCSEVFAPSAGDRFSAHAPFHFDLSILDLYVPIKHGAAIVLIGEDNGKKPKVLAPLIAEHGITVWYSTPSILRLLVEFGELPSHDHSGLRLVLFAGEVYPVKHLRALQELWPQARYVNLYGPTETNVCTYYEVPREIPPERTEPFPIGRACSGDRTLVVGADDREVERGSEGELLVAGGSVMLGYWNQAERNAQAFHVDGRGERWYRTGDVVRDPGDGDLEFLGRKDRMVKRRGYRVELGEIEAALYRHPAVVEAAVIAGPAEDGGVRIRAFLNHGAAQRPSLVELKRFCSENLPAYMIPDQFSALAALPRTSTDKIDYQKLKQTD